MKFYVIWLDGRRFGPADVPTLNEWIKQNRLKSDTDLENADTGERVKARDVPGLSFASVAAPGDQLAHDPALKPKDPMDQPQQTAAPGSPYQAAGPTPTGGPEQPSGQYQQPPQPGVGFPGAHAAMDDGSQKMITNAWIMIAISFFCSCLILPPFAIVQANKAKALGNPNAQAPLVVAWILTVLFIIGIIVNVIMFLVMGVTAFGM